MVFNLYLKFSEVQFLQDGEQPWKSNRLSDLSKTSQMLQKATRDSTALTKCMCELIDVSPASSFNLHKSTQKRAGASAAPFLILYKICHQTHWYPAVNSENRAHLNYRDELWNRQYYHFPFILYTSPICWSYMAQRQFRWFWVGEYLHYQSE